MVDRFQIIKTESGSSYNLLVGRPGIPGSHRVEGLTREQVDALGPALHSLCARTRNETQEKIKSAMGIR